MEIAVGLGREAGVEASAVFSCLKILKDELFDKIKAFRLLWVGDLTIIFHLRENVKNMVLSVFNMQR